MVITKNLEQVGVQVLPIQVKVIVGSEVEAEKLTVFCGPEIKVAITRVEIGSPCFIEALAGLLEGQLKQQLEQQLRRGLEKLFE